MGKNALTEVSGKMKNLHDHCGAILEKIIYPFVGLNRAMDEDGVPLPLGVSYLDVSSSGRIGVTKTTEQDDETEKGVRLIVELRVTAEAVDKDTRDHRMTAVVTAHAHFRCDPQLSADQVETYLQKNGDEAVRCWTLQIYAPVIMELERLVTIGGLPPLDVPLSPPNMTASEPTKKAAAAKKNTKPARQTK